jgi:lysophospholipase L1-like esterase
MLNTTIIVLGIVTLIVLVVILEAVRISLLLHKSRLLTRSIRPFQQLNPNATMRILLIGDSTAYGTGTVDPRNSISGRLAKELPKAHIENRSVTGAGLGYVAKRLREITPERPYDLVIIMAGGINVTYSTPIWRLKQLTRSAIERARRIGTRVIFVAPNNAALAPIFRFPLSSFYRLRAVRTNTAFIDECNKQNVPCVSLFHEDNDPVSALGLRAADLTHPNDDGYGLWYEQIRNVVLKTMAHESDQMTKGSSL